MVVPTVTLKEVTDGINASKDETVKKVLIGILNDYMDLQYAKSTPYTKGQTILPNETTIEDIDTAANNQSVEKKYTLIFKKISETYKSGSLTPQSKNGENGNFWDPSLTPVLVVVRPNP